MFSNTDSLWDKEKSAHFQPNIGHFVSGDPILKPIKAWIDNWQSFGIPHERKIKLSKHFRKVGQDFERHDEHELKILSFKINHSFSYRLIRTFSPPTHWDPHFVCRHDFLTGGWKIFVKIPIFSEHFFQTKFQPSKNIFFVVSNFSHCSRSTKFKLFHYHKSKLDFTKSPTPSNSGK